MSARSFLSRLAWPVVGAACVSVAGFGLYVSLHALSAAKTWEGRYYAVAAENEELKEQLSQVATKKVEMVVSVAGSEYAPRTLALKNRNYLNIKQLQNGDRWKGSLGEDKHGHVIFESPAWSIRAGAITLRTYERKHGLKTITELVHRFAEGNRPAYIRHLCRALGVKPDQKISFTKYLPELLKAMVQFETGQKLGREHLELVAALR